jgi:hypothetical protein
MKLSSLLRPEEGCRKYLRNVENFYQSIRRHRSAVTRLYRLWVRIPPGVWMSVVSDECSQVEVSASGWSLVQRSPTECGMSESDREASTMWWPWPSRGCCAMGGDTVSHRSDSSKNWNLTKVSYFSCVSSAARSGIILKTEHRPLTRARARTHTHKHTHTQPHQSWRYPCFIETPHSLQ